MEKQIVNKNILEQLRKVFLYRYNEESWGTSVLIISKNGKAFVSVHRYDDELNTIYISDLHVDITLASKGIGTKLLRICELFSMDLHAEFACLKVNKNLWIYDWYKRKGYDDYMIDKDDSNFIWMRKLLN